MANRSKGIGTGFETATCRYMRRELGDDRIERRALHGSHDMGDLFGIRAHGHEGIAECKAHSCVTESRLAKWQEQTVRERENADADFALLVVRRPGCNYRDADAPSFGSHDVYVQVRDLHRISGMCGGMAMYPDALREWVRLPLARACALIAGVTSGGE